MYKSGATLLNHFLFAVVAYFASYYYGNKYVGRQF